MVVLFQNECELTLVFMREQWLWCVVSASGLRWKASRGGFVTTAMSHRALYLSGSIMVGIPHFTNICSNNGNTKRYLGPMAV